MSTVDETVRLLAATEVFGEVEPRELEEVAKVAVPRHWDRGEVIFREGDVGDTCYLIRSGAILLTREHQDGRMVALAELRAGHAVRRARDVPRRAALGHRGGDRARHGAGAAREATCSAWCGATPTSR